MVALADLQLWTPVSLSLQPAPSIDWCDMTGIGFEEPFFDQSVARAVEAGRPLIRTDLDALLALDEAPALEPCGIIGHLSRCGSTLLSRLLGAVPGTVVLSEPGPLNTLLQADPALVDEAVRVRVIRLLVRALGRIRSGDERRLVLKLSSWNVRRLPLLRRAFPEVPLVWLQRAPQEVVASILRQPPGWLELRRQPGEAAELFGLAPDEPAPTDAAGFAVAALGALLQSAEAAPDALVVDYRELPAAAWGRVARHFGIEADSAVRARMAALACYQAKAVVPTPFDPAADRARSVPAEIASLVAARLEPAYRRLEARRVAQPGEAGGQG